MNFWQNVLATMKRPVKVDNVRSGRTFSKGEDNHYASGDVRIGRDIKDRRQDKYIDNAVNSTAVQSIEWDPKTNNAKVQFTSGTKKYDYPMDKHEFDDFLHADSKGRWINSARVY